MLCLSRSVAQHELYRSWRKRLIRRAPAELWFDEEQDAWVISYAVWHPSAFEAGIAFLVAERAEPNERCRVLAAIEVVRPEPSSNAAVERAYAG